MENQKSQSPTKTSRKEMRRIFRQFGPWDAATYDPQKHNGPRKPEKDKK